MEILKISVMMIKFSMNIVMPLGPNLFSVDYFL